MSNPTELVPKIVITEPSPLPIITNTGLVQNVLRMSDKVEAVVPTVTPLPEPPVAVTKEDVNMEPKKDAIVDSVSVSASDTDSCSVSVERNKVQEVAMEVVEEAGMLTLPEIEEVADDDFRDVPTCEGIYESCCLWLESFSESKLMLPILILLLAMPISAGFMGARYMDKCPLSNAAPIFLFMLGLLGTVVILCRMWFIVQKMFGRGSHKLLGMVVVFGNLAILLLLCTEMMSFLRIWPSFEPGTQNYCHRIFYNFTYWLNWTSLFVIVFLVIIHAPKCSRQTSQTENIS